MLRGQKNSTVATRGSKTNKQTPSPQFQCKRQWDRMLRSQGEALVGIYFQGLIAPVCKHISQNSIKQQVSKMANLMLLFSESALSWLILLPKESFQTSLQDKAEGFSACLQLLQQPTVRAGRQAGRLARLARLELGAAWAPPPPGALTISRLRAESGTSCTAMVSDSHAQSVRLGPG